MILVTGATGLLGNNIVREALARQMAVRVYVRGHGPRIELQDLPIEVHRGELTDPNAMIQAAQGCSAVIHCAAMVHFGFRKLAESRQANVIGTQAVIDACKATNCRLIHVSTLDTLPAAVSPDQPINEQSSGVPKTRCDYVVSKTEAEAAVVAAVQEGLDALITHPGLMFAPYDWKPSSGALMATVAKAPWVPAPTGTSSVCDARDVANALLNALQCGVKGEHYILAGENISYQNLIQRIVAVMHQKKKVFRMGPIIPAAAKVVDLWNRVTGAQEGQFNGAVVAMSQLHHAYDSSKAERVLNYRRRPLDESLADAWAWLSQRLQTNKKS